MTMTTIGANITRRTLPTGQFVTPTALSNAVQQYLNPGLPATRISSRASRARSSA
jgi:hypothetical protein